MKNKELCHHMVSSALSAAGCGVHYLKLKTHLRKLLALRREQITLGCRKCSISAAFSRKEERKNSWALLSLLKMTCHFGQGTQPAFGTLLHTHRAAMRSHWWLQRDRRVHSYMYLLKTLLFSPFSTWGHSNKFIFRNSLQKLTVKVRSITGFRNDNKYEAGLQMAVKHLKALRLTSGSRVYALCLIFFINYLSLVWKKDYSLV